VTPIFGCWGGYTYLWLLFPFESTGLYKDSKNDIKGTYRPLIIHTGKSKTKAKEAEAREKQKNGETPIPHQVGM
jgi:hypothetical protein